jgi:hypothetical protein
MNLFYNPSTWKSFSMAISFVLSLLIPCSIQAQENRDNRGLTLIADNTTCFQTNICYIQLNGSAPGNEARDCSEIKFIPFL